MLKRLRKNNYENLFTVQMCSAYAVAEKIDVYFFVFVVGIKSVGNLNALS